VAGFARTGGAEKTNANKQRLQTEAPDALPTMFPRLESDRLWLSGQSNVIFQTHPPFPAAYSGENSLNPNYEKATSRVLTLYTGRRLNNSTGFLLDIEEAGGAALSTGLGLAGNTDLDIVRNPLLSKAPYMARGMIHKVFALSKDKVLNDSNALSLFPVGAWNSALENSAWWISSTRIPWVQIPTFSLRIGPSTTTVPTITPPIRAATRSELLRITKIVIGGSDSPMP